MQTVVIDGECLNCRDAVDSVVQKALALLLTPLLEPTLDRHGYHLAERGGCKATVMHMEHHARHYLRSED